MVEIGLLSYEDEFYNNGIPLVRHMAITEDKKLNTYCGFMGGIFYGVDDLPSKVYTTEYAYSSKLRRWRNCT